MTPEAMCIALAEARGIKLEWIGQNAYRYPDCIGQPREERNLPNPPADANDALAVVEMMREKGWIFDAHAHMKSAKHRYPFESVFTKLDMRGNLYCKATAPTLPLAICEAALKALNLWTE